VVVAPGTLTEGVTRNLEEARDITCAEAIIKQFALTPDVVGWWDYTSPTPIFNARRRADLSAIDIDATAGDQILAVTCGTRRPVMSYCGPIPAG
jgi:hypothetical protein